MYPRIRELRISQKLTQQTLASFLHCSQRMYSRYEKGEVQIPLPILVDLADYYKTSVDFLLNLTDEHRPYPKKRKLR